MEQSEIEQIIIQMDELKSKQADLKSQLKACESEIDKLNLSLQGVLSDNKKDLMTVRVLNIPFSFGWETKTRTAFNQSLFKDENPDLFDKYKITSENKVFKFGVRKDK